jgi:hypothetical protein
MIGLGHISKYDASSPQYHVVVTLRASPWGWEIYRDGVPLPVPLRGG